MVSTEKRGEMSETTSDPEGRTTRDALRAALASVHPLVTLSREGLVITAIEWGLVAPPAYETATAAARSGDLELRERAGGSVPAIEAVTKEHPVVLFAGDTVVGGKQNRIINVTVWLAAMKVTSIPVSCLEAGRWNDGFRFAAGRKVDYLLRSRMIDQLDARARAEYAALDREDAPHAARRASYAADQGAVWQEIAAKQTRAAVHSPTAALHDLYERETADLASIVTAFPCPAGASGLAVGIGGRLVALELFDSAATLAEQWPRLVEGAASAYLDDRRAVVAGLEPAPRHRYPDEGALGRLLGRAGHALGDAVVGPSVGEGFDVRLRGEKVRGGALVVAGQPVHIELFRVEA